MASIQGIYVALFGRPADPAGLAFFNEATNNGADLTAIGDLASTAEYQDRFTGMSSEEIVNSIYQSLFERDGEAEGIQFFVNALENGTYTINNIAIAILDGAQGDDLATVNAKIAAADLFTARLDLDEELEAYFGMDAASIGRGYLELVDADNPADAALADEWILKLFGPDEGQQPGGGGGGGTTPDTTAPIGIVDPLSAGDGTFKAGETITFTVKFGETVVVEPATVLTLSNGGTAGYASGSGSNAVTFTYTVSPGQNDSDLEVTGTSGGTIKDAAGNVGSVTPTSDLDIVIDTIAPEGSASAAPGPYSAGNTIEFTVTFTEDVEASGASLDLTGGRIATISSGSGTDTLTFAYVVAAGESAADVDIVGLNGVTDPAGNAATLDASTLDTSLVITPPGGEVHVYDAAGAFVAVYSTAPAPAGFGGTWVTNAYPINAAVNASLDNYTVMVGQGEYTTGGTPIQVTQDGLRIMGAQYDVDPRSAAGERISGDASESIINGANGSQVFRIFANDVELNGFEIYGSSADAVTTTNATSDGGKSGAFIANNIVRNAGDDGIVLYKHFDGVVHQNLIYAVADGINIAGNDAISAIAVSSGNTASDNEIFNSWGNGAIYVYDSTFSTISGNLIYDYGNDSGIVLGLRRGSGNPQQDGGEISDNVIRGTAENGIDVFQSDVTVGGNTIENVPGWAIAVGIDYNNETRGSPKPDNVDIFDNIIRDANNTKNAPEGPFRIVDGSTDIVFSGNFISGDERANTLSGSSGADIFVFEAANGVDTVVGLARGSDKLNLTGWGTDFAALDDNADGVLDAGDTAVSVVAGNLTITQSPGSSVTLTGVASLDAADFVS